MQRSLIGLVLAFCWTLTATAGGLSEENSTRLAKVLKAQPEELQARYPSRHPQQTLEFFGIEPGMTVVEVLPGRGWYSPILVSYLGSDGMLIGADYRLEIWPNFSFGTPEYIARKRAWVEEWPATAAEWKGEDGASARAVRIGNIPDDLDGTADAVLFVRAMHNLSRFESEGGFRSAALEDTMAVLKPGGVVGIVQHEAPAGTPDTWADGSRGYLNKDTLIKQMKAAGFEYVGSSAVNNNPADVPGESDIVWRLPPSLMTSRNDPEKRAEYEAIGESNRMTLLFRKPA